MAGQSFTGSYLAGSIACNQWEPRPVGCHRPPADDDVELGPVAPADRSPSGLGCVAPVRRVSGCFHGPRRPPNRAELAGSPRPRPRPGCAITFFWYQSLRLPPPPPVVLVRS